jgi:hypothetical protein
MKSDRFGKKKAYADSLLTYINDFFGHIFLCMLNEWWKERVVVDGFSLKIPAEQVEPYHSSPPR